MEINLTPILFWIIAVLTGLCAISVVLTQNIVRAAVFLLFSVGGVAGIFFLLGANFIGAVQLLVYVGGTLVLVVFGVMLTAQGPFITMKSGAVEWAVSIVVGLLLFSVLSVTAVLSFRAPELLGQPVAEETAPNSVILGEALLGMDRATPEAHLTGVPTGESAPTRKQLAYLLPFEIISVHLLVVLIGAAYLARAKRRRGATP
ncbi:MAG: NADH-quinone oxidoreductase subunit J [Gemmataceae bacterium]